MEDIKIYVSWKGLETKTQNWVFVDHILDRKISIEEKSEKEKECEQVITEEHIRDAIKQRCVTICIWGLKPWKNLWMWNLNKTHMHNQYIRMNFYAKITQTH